MEVFAPTNKNNQGIFGDLQALLDDKYATCRIPKLKHEETLDRFFSFSFSFHSFIFFCNAFL
jgi:hypothetical protein